MISKPSDNKYVLDNGLVRISVSVGGIPAHMFHNVFAVDETPELTGRYSAHLLTD